MPPLMEGDLDPDPFNQFGRWFEGAMASGIKLPEAMILSTASRDAQPSSRVVLLKNFEKDGFTFFTNYDSRKSEELRSNPNAALLFYWPALDRQIRIEGTTEEVSDAESNAYFATRPRGSQIGAWASQQSDVIPDRATLERLSADFQRKYPKEVPRPPNWGGFRLRPRVFEFWQNQPDRLHDRFRYRRDGSRWVLERLAP
jgi:pyridoxamine 5'-phosphate oxidase